ncbi:MAG: hypothetical protein ABIS26_01590 [Candidatus Paceibacterota bacterium]
MKFIMPLIIIGIALSAFFVFANPIYTDIGALRAQVGTYDEALDNSKALNNERDKLTKKYNDITLEDLNKIKKLLPDNVDNIRLILEIEKIAQPYGMTLKEVKYNTNTDTASQSTASGGIQGGGVAAAKVSKDYGVWDLAFSTTGSYANFLNFLKDLQSNLRIVDIASISFSSTGSSGTSITSPGSTSEIYKYDFKIKTYWLKN